MKLKRTNEIIEYLKTYKLCTYEELAQHFDVSLSTVRRDIDELKELGRIEKVYGGIKIADDFLEQDKEASLYEFDYIKDKLAKEAVKLIEDGDIIILGSGSTVAHMVRHLKNKKNITLITNNLAIMNETLDCDFNVVSVGGKLDRTTFSFVGTHSSRQIAELNANKCFISCNGISEQSISNITDAEADFKKAEIRISNKTILLADRNKFDTMSLYSFATLGDIDYLITNEMPDKKYEKLCRENDCTLMITR